jgi:1-deoxy-D-xylulose-5-phosphate reductoisomerase
LNLQELNTLSFSEVKPGKYPCYDFSLKYIKKGPLYISALSIVNEILVDLFLSEKIPYTSISDLMIETLNNENFDQEMTFDNIIELREILKNKILNKIK